MDLSRYTFALFAITAMFTGSCSFFSNTVDTIKIECGIDRVESHRSYVKVLDSDGKPLRSSEFALRWLDGAGRPLSTRGNCIELDPKESAALIVRSRLASEGLIYETDSRDSERLSKIQLDAYAYGRLQKTCDQALNSNQLTLGLPANFEDHSASGYEIKASAVMDGQTKADWTFVNAGPAVPNLDIGSLSNGLYDLRFELNPLFSEGAVAQYFNCDLVVDRKSPQLALMASDGSLLANKAVELRPNSRVTWESSNRTATELIEYCFVAAGTDSAACSNPSISSDPIVIPENGSWKFIYRGIDAANNRSDWAAMDIDVVDEAKLADIRNKLELARFHQKSGQTQFVAVQLLLALETYRNLSSENERKRVKKELDLAIFQHQRDAQDYYVAQWNNKEAVDYVGTLRGNHETSAHVFLRESAPNAFGLSFIRNGSALHPEISLGNRFSITTCPIHGLAAYVQEGRLQIFDGNSVTTLPGDAERLSGIKNLKFSEDCRFLVMTDWIGVLFLIDRMTGKTVEFPEFEYDMECRFSFALGNADAVRYYSYCSRFNRNSWKLYAFTAAGNIKTPESPILNQLPLQLISKDNLIFFLASDKSFAIFDESFNTLFSSPVGRTAEIVFDGVRQRVLARYEAFGLYDIYEFNREGDAQGAVKKLSPSEVRIPTPVKFGDTLTVSQPSFSADVFYARVDDSTNSFLGHLPVDRDRLLDIDFADKVLFQSGNNLFREISPNASLLRRTIRLLRDELLMFPITTGTKTAFYTLPTKSETFKRYELGFNEPFVALAKHPVTSKSLGKDQTFTVFRYGSQELILLKGTDKLQFIVPGEDGMERQVELTLPPQAQAIPSSDPDLFWFHVPSDGSLYSVRASTGQVMPIDSFRTIMASVAARPSAAATRIFTDPFAGWLYLTYPHLMIKIRFNGPLDQPNFVAVETKSLKSPVIGLVPSKDFKKWFGLTNVRLDVYNQSFELESSFGVNDVFGKRSIPNFVMLASGLDPDTVFVSSSNGQLAHVDSRSKLITSIAFDRSPTNNSIISLDVDESGRLHYFTLSDWFTLPLDLDENRAHLCRYLGELGPRMYPEVKTQFKQLSCASP
jgi:hypothetical protein